MKLAKSVMIEVKSCHWKPSVVLDIALSLTARLLANRPVCKPGTDLAWIVYT